MRFRIIAAGWILRWPQKNASSMRRERQKWSNQDWPGCALPLLLILISTSALCMLNCAPRCICLFANWALSWLLERKAVRNRVSASKPLQHRNPDRVGMSDGIL